MSSLYKKSKPVSMKISTKVTLAIALTTMAIVVFLAALVTFQFRKAIQIEAERNLMTILSKEAEALNQELLRVKRLSLTLRTTVQQSLDIELAKQNTPLQNEYMSQYKSDLLPLVQNQILNFDNLSGWILFNSEVVKGTHTVSYTYESGSFVREPEYDVVKDGYAEEDWWREAIDKGEHWTEPYFWKPWNADIISYSTPIFIKDSLVGVAGAEFFMEPFQDRLRSIKVYNTGFVMLISEKGKQIIIPEEMDKLALSHWYDTNKTLLLSEKSGVQYLNKGSLLKEDIIAWQELSNGWFLIARPEASEMFSAIGTMYFTIFIILLFTLPFSILMGVSLSKSITRRLEYLVIGAENILNEEVAFEYISDGNDEIGVLVKAFHKMSDEIRNAVDQLKQSELKYRLLVENSEHMIFTLSLSGQLLTTNAKLEKMVGHPKEMLIGKSFDVLFRDEKDVLFWNSVFRAFLDNPQKTTIESTIVTDEGITRQLMTTLLPIMNDAYEIMGIMGTSADITEQIEAQKQISLLLEKENSQLVQSVEEKSKSLEVAFFDLMQTDKYAALGRMVSGIAHELNTPIGNAITLSSFIQSQLSRESNGLMNPAEDVLPALESLGRNLERATTIVEHFKALSLHNFNEKASEIQLCLLINMNVQSLINEMRFEDCEVEVRCDPSLKVKTFPSAFSQVIIHLLKNALVHGQMLEEQQQLKIIIDVVQRINGWSLVISDNGIGMSREVQEHIFEPFYTTRRGDGNSGLGLSIVFSIVTGTFGGKVFLESIPFPEPSHGTSIHCSFPNMNETK